MSKTKPQQFGREKVKGTPGAGEFIGVDLDVARRPGYRQFLPVEPLPNTKYPPTRQRSDVRVFMHNRPNKTFPPVFGTEAPPKGLSGLIRKAAYAYPDHMMRHWMMLLFADRVNSWERRVTKLLPFAVPAAAAFVFVRALREA